MGAGESLAGYIFGRRPPKADVPRAASSAEQEITGLSPLQAAIQMPFSSSQLTTKKKEGKKMTVRKKTI
jgi:hypothetical protein